MITVPDEDLALQGDPPDLLDVQPVGGRDARRAGPHAGITPNPNVAMSTTRLAAVNGRPDEGCEGCLDLAPDVRLPRPVAPAAPIPPSPRTRRAPVSVRAGAPLVKRAIPSVVHIHAARHRRAEAVDARGARP